MSHPPLTDRDAVLKAMAEYDESGRERFLKDHGYGEALTIYVEHNGRLYDSKALAGVAYEYQTREPYDRDGYKGGAPVERLFREMDFTIIRIPGGVARQVHVTLIGLEQHKVHEFEQTPQVGTRTAIKQEALLVEAYQRHLEEMSHTVLRHSILVADGSRNLVTDLFDQTDKVVYEAKSKSDRDTIRYALGQILDYRHLLNDDALSYRLLLLARPWASLIELLHAHEIGVTWRDGAVWTHELPSDSGA